MVLVSNVAVYGCVAGSSRAIDRYAGAVSGSLDAFERELLGLCAKTGSPSCGSPRGIRWPAGTPMTFCSAGVAFC